MKRKHFGIESNEKRSERNERNEEMIYWCVTLLQVGKRHHGWKRQFFDKVLPHIKYLSRSIFIFLIGENKKIQNSDEKSSVPVAMTRS